MTMRGTSQAFAVVVPFYNEERGIQATFDALARQSDVDFSIVLVDNASTDASPAIARTFAARTGASLLDSCCSLLKQSGDGRGEGAS